MSTEMSLFNGSKLPAHIAARGLNQNTLALAGSAPQGKRISIEGGVFRLIAGGKEIAKNKNREMNIVIVRTAPNNSRTFYDPATPYVRGQAAAPDCSSLDGVKPDARAKSPQAKTCNECPQNIAGSGNGDSRACRFNRRLAVVLDGDFGGDVYQLQLPATSLFGKGNGSTQNLPLEAYARMLASNNVNIDDVVTKMEFDTDASTPKLTFTAVRFLDADEARIIASQGETPEAEQAIGMTPFQMDTGGAAPVALPASKKESPVAAAEDDEEEETPAPVVETKVKKAKPPVVEDDDDVAEPVVAAKEPVRESKISNVLAAWGD